MGIFHSARLDERKIGLSKIDDLKKVRSKSLIIHYSCESFFNTAGRTPRVTSIAVKNRDNGNAVIFSIHLTAQVRNKNLTNLTDSDFDTLEKDMLKDFYEFVQRHKTFRWIHWNMRNASFGFEAISNRYRILSGTPKKIEDQFKYDLPEILGLINTYKFEKHDKPTKGQLLNLTKRNHITTKDALTGEEEAAAFDNRDFLLLHMSTMRKVEMIDRILNLLESKRLKIAASLITTCGLTIPGIIEIIRNNWLLFSLWSLGMAILGMALEPCVQNFFGTN